MPACFKWAGMAAIASHHVRLALFPLRLDTDRTGYVDIPHSLGRQKLLLMEDVNTIRATNNAIFNDIFWVHLAYVTAEDGIERLRALLRAEPPLRAGPRPASRRSTKDAVSWRTARRPRRLDGRPTISSGRATSSSSSTSSAPWCNPTSIASRARSPGSSRSARPRASRCVECGRKLRYFTSFYLYSLTRGVPHARACARVAEDHPLRRPLALARDERRSPLPQVRRRHALDRPQPATHPRRGARLRLDALRPAASTADTGGSGAPVRLAPPLSEPSTSSRHPRDPLVGSTHDRCTCPRR